MSIKIKKEELRLNDASIGKSVDYDYLYFDLPKEKGEEIFQSMGEECENDDCEVDNSYSQFEVCCCIDEQDWSCFEVLLYPMYEDRNGNLSAGDFVYLENGEFDDCMEFAVEQIKEVKQRGGLPL